MVEKRKREYEEDGCLDSGMTKLCKVLGLDDGDEEQRESVINSLILWEPEEEESLVLGKEVQEELLSDVMKSLQAEINLPSGLSTPGTEDSPSDAPLLCPQVDYSFLLEASDDELGIVSCSSPALSEADLIAPPLPAKHNYLELPDGEVIDLNFPALEEVEDPSSSEEWLRLAVAMLTDVMGPGESEFESLEQVLVESPGF